tara:strand:- start:522 stop:752 length:231 start_codon:yes stop_codon:yes gene_type:complete
MILHEVIKQIENDSRFIKLLQLGVIPLSVLDKKVYYERFLQESLKNSKMVAISNTSEEYNVCTQTIRRSIKLMTKD